MSQDLLKQIDDLVASKTFNLDALEGIKAIKDSLANTLAVLEDANRTLVLRREENQKLMVEVVEKEAKIERLKKTVEEMRTTSEKGQEAIYEAAKHKAVADAWQAAMGMVFKPNAVRETVQRNVVRPVEGHSGGNGSYPTAGYLATGTETESVVREDA